MSILKDQRVYYKVYIKYSIALEDELVVNEDEELPNDIQQEIHQEGFIDDKHNIELSHIRDGVANYLAI